MASNLRLEIEPLSVEDAMTTAIETQDKYNLALARIAELEAALQPFADFSDHVTDDGNHEVARVRYRDGTFGALFGDQFHAARTVLRKK